MFKTFAFNHGVFYLFDFIIQIINLLVFIPYKERKENKPKYHFLVLGLLRILEIDITLIKLTYLAEALILLLDFYILPKKEHNRKNELMPILLIFWITMVTAFM